MAKGSIRRRGNSFQLIVYLGLDPVTKKQNYHYETYPFTEKTEKKVEEKAEKALRKILTQIDDNTYVDSGNLTLGEYLERWLRDYGEPTLAPRTFEGYQEIIKLHIIPELGAKKLSKLQPLDLQEYYSKMLKEGRIGLKYKKKKGLSPTTVLQHHRIIHRALEQAVKWQLVGRNIADVVEAPKKEKVEFDVIDTEQLKKILAIAREKYPVALLPFYMAAVTGMRRGEVLGLRWRDLDLDTRTLSVRQQVQRIRGEGLIFRQQPKSKSSIRPLKLSEDMVNALKALKEKQEADKKSIEEEAEKKKSKEGGDPESFQPEEPVYCDHDLVFCWENGMPIDPDYVTKSFNKIAKKQLKLSVRFHDLRHSFATLLLSNKVAPKVVSATLGHSSIGITMDTYSHILPTMGDEVVRIMENVMKGVLEPEMTKTTEESTPERSPE